MKKMASMLLAIVLVFSLTACSGKNSEDKLQEYLNSDEVKSQLDALKDSMEQMGIQVDVKADGSKLIYAYTYTTQLDDVDAVKSALEEALAAQEDTFVDVANSLRDDAKIDDPVVVVSYFNADETEILTKEYAAD